MKNLKELIFYIIERSNFLAKILHKIWMFYTSTKCFVKLYLYKYTNIKIKSLSQFYPSRTVEKTTGNKGENFFIWLLRIYLITIS